MPIHKTSVTLEPRILAEIDRRAEYDGEGSRSGVISRHLDRYFSMLARARRELRQMFSDNETMLIVDVLNGVAFMDTVGIYMVEAEVVDGIFLDGLDKKWEIDKDALIGKLKNLTDAQLLALVDSVTMWWNRVAKGEQPAHTAADVFKGPPKNELEGAD